MKTGLKVYLLRRILRQAEGFTLLELTIVLVISGILAAIALPSFLNQASKAKQVEAKMYLGTLNHAQQGYMLEHSQFANDMNRLGIALYNSPNYRYSIQLDGTATQYAVHHAESLSSSLRPYVGMVAVLNDSSSGATVDTVLCEAQTAQTGKAAQPVMGKDAVDCAPGSNAVGQ